MFPFLLLAFIAVPLIEIALFIEVGGMIGTWPTITIVVGTALLGAWLLRRQGLATAQAAQQRLQRGEMPVDQALDGMFLVLAGALLLTPGFMTDAIGFSLFIPQMRRWLRTRALRWAARSARVSVYRSPAWPPEAAPRRDPGTIDVEADGDIATPPETDSPWHRGDGRDG